MLTLAIPLKFRPRFWIYGATRWVEPTKQARKPRSYASSKLRLTDSLTHLLTGVKCRATSVAKNTQCVLLHKIKNQHWYNIRSFLLIVPQRPNHTVCTINSNQNVNIRSNLLIGPQRPKTTIYLHKDTNKFKCNY